MALKSTSNSSDLLKSDKSDLKRFLNAGSGENGNDSSDSEKEIEVKVAREYQFNGALTNTFTGFSSSCHNLLSTRTAK